MNKTKTKVVAYGTLKQGHGNHRVMQMAGGRLLGNTVVENATMYSYGAFPTITLGTEGQVHGEVYEIERIEPLDRLEGFPTFYFRSLVQTEFGEAYIYHMPQDRAREANRLPKITSGIWK